MRRSKEREPLSSLTICQKQQSNLSKSYFTVLKENILDDIILGSLHKDVKMGLLRFECLETKAGSISEQKKGNLI